MPSKKEKLITEEPSAMSQSTGDSPQVVVIGLSKQSHSDYALDWFLEHLMNSRFRIVLANVIPAPMDLEYFASLGTFTVPPLVYTEEHFEAIKKKVMLSAMHS